MLKKKRVVPIVQVRVLDTRNAEAETISFIKALWHSVPGYAKNRKWETAEATRADWTVESNLETPGDQQTHKSRRQDIFILLHVWKGECITEHIHLSCRMSKFKSWLHQKGHPMWNVPKQIIRIALHPPHIVDEKKVGSKLITITVGEPPPWCENVHTTYRVIHWL